MNALQDTQKESHFPIFIHLGIPAFPLPLLSPLPFDAAAAAGAAPPPPGALASASLSAFALASLSASAAPGTTPLLRRASSSGRSLGASFGVVVVAVAVVAFAAFAAPPPKGPLLLELAGPQ